MRRYALLLLSCLLIPYQPAHAWNAPPTAANPTYYDMVPYTNPTCGCSPAATWPTYGGCCIGAGAIMNEIFNGTGNWQSDDFQNDFYIDKMYKTYLKPNFEALSASLRDAFAAQSILEGIVIDAQNLMHSTLTVQKANVQTNKNYAPSETICKFGTLNRNVAGSNGRAVMTANVIAAQAISRQMMRDGMSTASNNQEGVSMGGSADKRNRWQQYTTKFCDKNDFAGALNTACTNTADTQINRDIDVTRTLDAPYTLDLNYSGAPSAQTQDTQNIMALGANLYASDVMTNLTESDLRALAKQKFNDSASAKSLKNFFDYRTIVAKRSVAQNSYATIAGFKAAGDGSAAQYINEVVKKLGLPNTTAPDLLGAKPSYYAQMEVLTKLLYQDPAFYANLMEGNANIARQQSAMQGIALAQDRDIYESLRRSEMLMSTLLETYIMAEQDKFTDMGRR